MKCHLCNKSASIILKTSNLNYCKNCFTRLIERRIRRYIRHHQLIKKDDTLYIHDALSEYVIKKILKGLPITITHKKTKVSRSVIPSCLEDYTHRFLENLFDLKTLKFKQEQNFIYLFTPIMEEELVSYAKIRNLPYKKKKKDSIRLFLDNIEDKHPSTKNSLLRSIQKMQEILR